MWIEITQKSRIDRISVNQINTAVVMSTLEKMNSATMLSVIKSIQVSMQSALSQYLQKNQRQANEYRILLTVHKAKMSILIPRTALRVVLSTYLTFHLTPAP